MRTPGSLALYEQPVEWPGDWPAGEFGKSSCLRLAGPGLPLPTVFIPAGMTDTAEACRTIGPSGEVVDGCLVTTVGGKTYEVADGIMAISGALSC